ncbi:MAG: DUF6599 family protein [Armatimonadota bacterium]
MMNILRARAGWVCAVALTLCATVVAQEQPPTEERPPELEACPPPEGACSEDIVAHVLAEEIGSWRRQGDLVAGDVALTPQLISRLDATGQEALPTYAATCGAAVTYRNTAGPGVADVLMVGFEGELDALGFFAAQRTNSAKRVLLTSAAYRDGGVLHVYSCAFYIRVEVQEPHEQALPSDQYLAARLEVRLPQRVERPRIMDVLPRGWLNALTVSYEPTDLLGEDRSPMALGARQEVGAAMMRLQVLEAEDEAQARRWYTMMLQEALRRGRAWEIERLGDEAFFSGNGPGRRGVGMLQDTFVVHLSTDQSHDDAVSIARLVGTEIRITRQLPGEPEGYCPPLDPQAAQ